jgi:inositol monophosphatase family protein
LQVDVEDSGLGSILVVRWPPRRLPPDAGGAAAAATRSGSAASIRGDIAAGTLLIREAGGFVTGADGEADFLETGSICCGNETMHRELLALLRSVA